MQNRPTDADLLIERLWDEVQKRKFADETLTPAVGQSTGPLGKSDRQINRDRLQGRIRDGKAALDRALEKHSAARRWPRFLRFLRRDQAAVNESLIGAISSLLKAVESLQENRPDWNSRYIAPVGQRKREWPEIAQSGNYPEGGKKYT